MATPPSSYLTPDLARLLADKARSFSYAARFLPSDQREATRVLYAFCRTMDDLVDEPAPGGTPEEIRQRLGDWRAWLSAGAKTSDELPEPAPLARGVSSVVAGYELPTRYLIALLDGVESDLGPVQMPDFPALRQYCMLVAGVVGLAMCHLLGVKGRPALSAAANLGIAMQLTNVLRDVGSDLRRDRIYLPADEMARFGYDEQRLRALAERGGRADDDFRALMRYQIARASAYYERGLAGVWLLPPDVRAAILSAGRIYRAILGQIEANDYDVPRRRAITSGLVKAREGLAARALVLLWGRRVTLADESLGADSLCDEDLARWLTPESRVGLP
jgi:15-cis-phytoene synthase